MTIKTFAWQTVLPQTTLKVVFLFLSLQCFGQGGNVKFIELPAAGTYNDDSGNQMLKVTGDASAVNIVVSSYKEDVYYSKVGSFLTDRSQFEDLDYTIKFRFIEGGGKSSIGVKFQNKIKGGNAERYIYCILSKNGSLIAGRYDDKPVKCKLNKGEVNTLQITKTGVDWKFIVNGVTVSERRDYEPLVVSGKETGQLAFGANQTIEITSITQEFKNGTLGYNNVPVKITPRELAYYQGDYVMSSPCGAFKDFTINVRTYRIGADMYAEVKGISPDVNQIRLEEKETQVYTAAHAITYIPSLKEYGTELRIDDTRFFFKDFTLRDGVIVFTLYFEQENGVDYTKNKIISNYKVLDCFFKSK